ncbi:MAG: AraC family transcriptional regulator ligand-binding domain-containing protein [Oleispira sp.]|nr:AraC family transcriptional regulator ligand-binding domain-containing protein [Oleispira sp.]
MKRTQLKEVCTKEPLRITQEPTEKLILNFIALTKNPALGFAIGETLNFSSHGAVRFAVLTDQ